MRWAAEKDKKAQEEVSTPETAKLEARIAELLDVDVTSAPRRFGQRNFFTRIGRKDAKPRYFYDENGTEVLWLDTNELNGSVSAVVPRSELMTGVGGARMHQQTLRDSFSAVSKPTFAYLVSRSNRFHFLHRSKFRN